jgi:CheY-like chemotaxis protein
MTFMAPATVLVVDDDPVILKLLEVNFEMEGFSVVRAADGAEGLERAREVLPDIVILDVMMPRMTGYEVAKALREDDVTAHIPIIFVTARAQSSDVERGLELGVDDYVTKPFDPLDLIARVHTLLARRPGGGGPAGHPESHPETGGAPEGNGSAPGAARSPGEVPSGEVPPGEVPSGGVPSGGVPSGGVPSGGTPAVPPDGGPVVPIAEAPVPPGDTDRGLGPTPASPGPDDGSQL